MSRSKFTGVLVHGVIDQLGTTDLVVLGQLNVTLCLCTAYDAELSC